LLLWCFAPAIFTNGGLETDLACVVFVPVPFVPVPVPLPVPVLVPLPPVLLVGVGFVVLVGVGFVVLVGVGFVVLPPSPQLFVGLTTQSVVLPFSPRGPGIPGTP
jgi:hypothetical protein